MPRGGVRDNVPVGGSPRPLSPLLRNANVAIETGRLQNRKRNGCRGRLTSALCDVWEARGPLEEVAER